MAEMDRGARGAIQKEEAPLEEAPLEEAPLEEAPLEEAPLEEAPLEEVPLEEVLKREEAPDGPQVLIDQKYVLGR